ncbi:MAG: hypothetical protein NDI90_20610 [Nitrospira sp. BO4]|jgi:hypothetical protein|nr:hypothetical protein [Nitrospira sp. BO4]
MVENRDSGGDTQLNEWDEFLKTIQDAYRRAEYLKQELDAIPDQDLESPLAKALQKEFAEALAEALSREAFMEECRRKGEPGPKVTRFQGTG